MSCKSTVIKWHCDNLGYISLWSSNSRWRIRTVNWLNPVIELLIDLTDLKNPLRFIRSTGMHFNVQAITESVAAAGTYTQCADDIMTVILLWPWRHVYRGMEIDQTMKCKMLTPVFMQSGGGFRNSSTTRSHDNINSSDPVTVPSIISRWNWNSLGNESSR